MSRVLQVFHVFTRLLFRFPQYASSSPEINRCLEKIKKKKLVYEIILLRRVLFACINENFFVEKKLSTLEKIRELSLPMS